MCNYSENQDFFEELQKFCEYFDKNLLHNYEELETQREKYLNSLRKRIVLCILVFVAVFFTYSLEIYFYYFVFIWWLCWVPFYEYKKSSKALIMDKILQFWGNFKYCEDESISKEYIEESALFRNFDKQAHEDDFVGKYHDVVVKVSEQKLSGASEKGVTFSGFLISLGLDKKYKGNTVVLGKNSWKDFLYYNLYKWLFFLFSIILFFWGLWYIRDDIVYFCTSLFFGVLIYGFVLAYLIKIIVFRGSDSEEKQRISLEDVFFLKEWKVYSDNQVEARYVLTPALMERILAVKKLFYGNRIDFAFWKNNLLIAVHTHKDMFETTSLLSPALNYDKVLNVFCQFYSIFKLVDELKLSNKKESF